MELWTRFTLGDGHAGFGRIDGGEVVEYEGDMFEAPRATGRRLALDGLTRTSPCVPTKVVALWNNFRALGAKLGKAAPSHTLFLIKPSTSLAGPNDPIRRPRHYAGKIAFEGELGIVIGKRCKDATVAEAAEAIFGYTCVNDVTAAELLNEDPNFAQWTRAKGFDTFSCVGPAIARGFDWTSASVMTRVDGVERQNYPLSDMIFSPEEQVAMISQDMTLLPGDVIAIGTSVGVGSFKDGQTVEIEIPGIGVLANRLEAR